MEGDIINIGYPVYSDFGPHLAVIRSFSYGANFPTEYPHFADGTIRYHFMFQFLAGNLEYLGLNITNAFNIPSILSMVSVIMLLYTLALIVTGSKAVGILTNIFFFFRSSFASLTFSKDFQSFPALMQAVIHGKDIDGNGRAYIGNTAHEDWGLWSQNVFVNQRHLAFGIGTLLLVIILVIPYFIKVDEEVKAKKNFNTKSIIKNKVFRELFLERDSWMPETITVPVVCGLLLGLLAFWNGAVVIAGLSILFILALFSKNKLSFLVIACIVTILTLLQSEFFVPHGNQVVSPEFYVGFLAGSDVSLILKYIIELFGILPFILLCVFISTQENKKKQNFFKIILSIGTIAMLMIYMPETKFFWRVATPIILAAFIGLYQSQNKYISKSTIPLLFAFLAPFVVAFLLKLTPDIPVNHKYIMISIMLSDIVLAAILVEMFEAIKNAKNRWLKKIILASIIFMLISTGIIDAFTLFNLTENDVKFDSNDKTLIWVKENTNPNDLFLTYQAVCNPVLLAGRKIYYGWPYFTYSAGYNLPPREDVLKCIYGGNNAEEVKELAVENDIRYIVIDAENRNAQEYTLNEDLFDMNFDLVYFDESTNTKIFNVEPVMVN
jgi:hypothetical protein